MRTQVLLFFCLGYFGCTSSTPIISEGGQIEKTANTEYGKLVIDLNELEYLEGYFMDRRGICSWRKIPISKLRSAAGN
ncbi:hypothetical protein HY628_02875 [Candidatus Uhrbacteria bacterium]|nr:hypothetical protein [Candidatus Uhrbacteria bacterium]